MNYISVAILSFWAGWFVNGYRYEHNMQEFINSELRQQIQAYEQTQAKERENLDKALKSAEETKDALDDVTARYNQLLADSLSKSSASSDNSMSANAKTFGTVQTNANKCVRTDTAEFQRLYQKQLALAKQCDELNVKYVRLYDLYQQLADSTNN